MIDYGCQYRGKVHGVGTLSQPQTEQLAPARPNQLNLQLWTEKKKQKKNNISLSSWKILKSNFRFKLKYRINKFQN